MDFNWFTGVVEDIIDPKKMNRVRVRCFGIHSQNKSDIQTDQLPWATVMMPTTASGVSGLQHSPHGLVQGSWVVGFFRDGKDRQDPIIMGSIASMPMEAANSSAGFNDPDGKYPKQEYVGESDVNKLARETDTEAQFVQTKKDTVELGVSTANKAYTDWDEPETPWVGTYPYNKVYESESGHVMEVDDTEGAERLHRYHKAGTFEEIHPDGSRVTRVVGDDYEIKYKDNNVYVKGNVNLTIDQNCTTYVKGNWDVQVDGNMTMTIKGNQTINTAGTHNETVGGSSTTTVSGNFARNSGTHIEDNAPRIDHN